MMLQFNKASEEYIEKLAEEIEVPPTRYQAAERSYHSVGEWLDRDESTLKQYEPQVYIQGSFRLGTAIRPVNNNEDYDIDLVCELNVGKTAVTQAELKKMLGLELKSYCQAHSLEAPEPARRCWTVEYADGAQFHLDALPAIPDATAQRLLLELAKSDTKWAETAIAITDVDHPSFRRQSSNWPHSNPKGFTAWFQSRMNVLFKARREAMALRESASVEDIPEYRVKTPLQQAIQLLKRHRDQMFESDPDDKPISIIITTLSAHAYKNEANVAEALRSILDDMDKYIENRNGVHWIPNPTDPAENFADRWKTYPQRYENFTNWLSQARSDFANVAGESNRARLVEASAPIAGEALAKRAGGSQNSVTGAIRRWSSVFSASHRKAPPWATYQQGTVRIKRALISRSGFRPTPFVSDSEPLPKHASLAFHAETDIPLPYSVYWQVVNTGQEAADKSALRGGFDIGTVTRGSINRQESTLYKGGHTIECFIVKNDYLAARSGRFIVNIV